MKTVRFEVRCTAEEKEAWEFAAKRNGVSVSEWLRLVADKATGLAKDKPAPSRPKELCTTCFVKGYANCERCKGEVKRAELA